MQSGPWLSFKEIALLPAKVRELYKERGIRIRPRSDLARMLELCTDIDVKFESFPADQRLEVSRAYRALHALADCADQTEVVEPLRRIAAKSLMPGVPRPSSGKDALFELELLQYMRYRGLTARLGEPDIIVTAPFGEYSVACKTIYSLKNFETQLSDGTKQIERHGAGCIVFNLEPHMVFEQPLPATGIREVTALVTARLEELYDGESWRFDEKLEADRLDGVMLTMSCTADIPRLNLPTVTSTVFYSRSDVQCVEARHRFKGFRHSMEGPLTTYRVPRG